MPAIIGRRVMTVLFAATALPAAIWPQESAHGDRAEMSEPLDALVRALGKIEFLSARFETHPVGRPDPSDALDVRAHRRGRARVEYRSHVDGTSITWLVDGPRILLVAAGDREYCTAHVPGDGNWSGSLPAGPPAHVLSLFLLAPGIVGGSIPAPWTFAREVKNLPDAEIDGDRCACVNVVMPAEGRPATPSQTYMISRRSGLVRRILGESGDGIQAAVHVSYPDAAPLGDREMNFEPGKFSVPLSTALFQDWAKLLPPGQPAPVFEGESLSLRKKVKLSEYRGRRVLLDFFSDWSPIPTHHWLSQLDEVRKRINPNRLEVVAIAPTNAKDRVLSQHQQWRLGLDVIFCDNYDAVEKAYRVSRTPVDYLLDERGIILVRTAGFGNEGRTPNQIDVLNRGVDDLVTKPGWPAPATRPAVSKAGSPADTDPFAEGARWMGLGNYGKIRFDVEVVVTERTATGFNGIYNNKSHNSLEHRLEAAIRDGERVQIETFKKDGTRWCSWSCSYDRSEMTGTWKAVAGPEEGTVSLSLRTPGCRRPGRSHGIARSPYSVRDLHRPLRAVAVSGDGQTIAAITMRHAHWGSVEITSGADRAVNQVDGLHDAKAVALSADGQTLAIAHTYRIERRSSAEVRGEVRLIDVASRRLLKRMDVPRAGYSDVPIGVAITQDGTKVACARFNTIDLGEGLGASRSTLESIPAPGFRGVMAFSPDGRRLAAALQRSVKIWNLSDGTTFEIPSRPDVVCLVFSPDGRRLACRDNHASVLYDMESERQLWQPDHSVGGYTTSLAFSRDGGTLLEGASDGWVRLRSAVDGKLQRAFKGHLRGVMCTAALSDGETLFTCDVGCGSPQGATDEEARLMAMTGAVVGAAEGRFWTLSSLDGFAGPTQVLDTGLQKLAGVALFPNGDSIAATDGREVVLASGVQRNAPRIRDRLEAGGPLAVSLDGQVLVGTAKGHLVAWDVGGDRSLSELRRIELQAGMPGSPTFSDDSRILYLFVQRAPFACNLEKGELIPITWRSDLRGFECHAIMGVDGSVLCVPVPDRRFAQFLDFKDGRRGKQLLSDFLEPGDQIGRPLVATRDGCVVACAKGFS